MEFLNKRAVQSIPKTYSPEKRSVDVIVASDSPATILDYDRWEFIDEILLMDGMELPEGRSQVPALDSHNRWETDRVLGSLTGFKTVENRKEAVLSFASTERAKTAETLVKEGHLTDLSVGYKALESIYVPQNESTIVNGRTFKGPIKVTKRWLLRETSLTAIGADSNAIIRTPEFVQELTARGVSPQASDQQIIEFMRQELQKNNSQPSIHAGGNMETKTPEQLEAERKAAEQSAERLETERKTEIEAVAKKFEDRIDGGKAVMERLKADAVELDRSADLFKGDVFLRIKDGEPVETPETFLDLSAKDKQRYNFRNVILAQLENREGKQLVDLSGRKIDTTFERECSEAVARKIGPSKRGGLFVPYDIQTRGVSVPPHVQREIDHMLRSNGIPLSTRDLTVGVAAAGGNLVGTQLMSFIDFLRNKMVLMSLGVQQMSGLIGNVAIPKQTADPTFGWQATEAAALTETEPTIGQVTLNPKSGGTYTDMSRQLLLQSTPSVDVIVQNSLARVTALGVDKAGFHGSGASGQPTGIASAAGIGSVDGVGFGWPAAVEFESDVAGANADAQSMSFVTRPTHRGTMKIREKALNTAKFLIEDPSGLLNGYPVQVTNQVNSGFVFFGDFSQLVLGSWGVIEFLVDPYTASTTGNIRIRVFITVDFGVLQAGAFSVCSNFS
jgi:HK97 family phage major capsid protein